MESGLGDLDGAFGGIGSAIGSAMTNPLGAMIGILTASSARVDAIGASFGGMGVTKFKDELLEANTAFMGMGLSGEDSLVAVKGLTSEYGVGMDEAIGMASAVGDLAKSTGMSVEESTKLTGFFQMSSGLSGEAATNLLKSADALAVANGVAPGAVLEDIANNTETFAKFGKDGGKTLAKEAGTMLLGQVPIVQAVREGGDQGTPVFLNDEKPAIQKAFDKIAKNLLTQVAIRAEYLEPTKVVEIKE